MLAITVDLLHGTVRAGSPDDTVMTGAGDGEWPLSPARLFSALVAADGTRQRCTVTRGDELLWLEALDPPRIYASAPGEVLVSRLEPRFAVVDATDHATVQDYPARSARTIRPGVRQAPANPRLVYVWPDTSPPVAVLEALRARADRIGYIGCADSPARVFVSDSLASGLGDPWMPDPGARSSLPVPYPGFVDALDHAFDEWSVGHAMRRAWVRSVRAGYRAPGPQPCERPEPTTIWLRLSRGLAGRKLVAFTETLRAAVMDHLQRLLPGEQSVPALVHGHRQGRQPGSQARFLALPDVGARRSDGRLLGAAVWLPPDTPAQLVQATRTAVARLSGERLVRRGWFDVALSVHGGERRPWAAHPNRWSRRATRWFSATPVVHERWTKGPPRDEEVARWCRHAGLPDPVRCALLRHPVLPGALDLRPDQVHRPQRDRRPHSHVVLEFEEPVRGPVVVGRGRHLGLGLLVPGHPTQRDG